MRKTDGGEGGGAEREREREEREERETERERGKRQTARASKIGDMKKKVFIYKLIYSLKAKLIQTQKCCNCSK
jgi:hypothetical protein